MGALKSKLNFVKVKDFLFKNKKRKIIVACAFALAIVLLLCAILIPVLSKMNKRFKSEEEMLTYMTGVYAPQNRDKVDAYYIFDVNNKCYSGSSFSYGHFRSYFSEYLGATKNLDAVKKLTFEECINSIEIIPFKDAEFQYSKGRIILKESKTTLTIDIKKDAIMISDSGNTYRIWKLADTPLECDAFKENFETAKKAGINISEFLPDFKELKERIKTDSRTSALVNTNYSMSAINDNEDMDTFFLGKCTKADQKESAWIYDVDSSATDGAGLTLFSTDRTVSLEDLLTILDLYLKDVPTYPGESAHGEIKDKIYNGEFIVSNNGLITNSEFSLFGIDFTTSYQERNDAIKMYWISVHPKSISLS